MHAGFRIRRRYNPSVVHRFFAPGMDAGDEQVSLPKDEAEHLTRVLRVGVGDTVTVFDGRGREFLGRVTAALRREVRVQLLSAIEPAAESAVHLTLVQAVLKGDTMDDVVRDAVMLGVAAIQPIVTRRTEATVAALLRGARLDRWRRIALASVKQSRRAVLPEIQMPLTFETYLDEPAPLRLMLVEPGIAAAADTASRLRQEPVPSHAAILVGPEGGWDERECAQGLAAGARLLTLGQRTLRADAVPVAAISVLQFLWDT
jgi:16S rRNA (uracil1498-N3)-methyltransferase